jgi:hypothetical protein
MYICGCDVFQFVRGLEIYFSFSDEKQIAILVRRSDHFVIWLAGTIQ